MTVNRDMYTIPQAAKYCSISRGTLWRCVKSGDLKASLTPGGHYRILKKDLESFMFEKGMYPLANPHSPRKKILIMDDDLEIQELLAKMLSGHKYETEVASDGFEAGVKTMEFRPGLIILDLFMPGINGFELCRQIKEKSNTSHIKILALTGYDTKKNRDRIMQAGADGYLAKPVKMSTLLSQVKSLLDHTSKRAAAKKGENR